MGVSVAKMSSPSEPQAGWQCMEVANKKAPWWCTVAGVPVAEEGSLCYKDKFVL